MRELYANNAKLLSRKSVTIPPSRTNTSSEFSIKLSYLEGTEPAFISTWNISTLGANSTNLQGSKIKATFVLDKNGLVELESAVASVEVEEEVEIDNTTATANATTTSETANATEVPKEAAEESGDSVAQPDTPVETTTTATSTANDLANTTATAKQRKLVRRTHNIKLPVKRSFVDEQASFRLMTDEEFDAAMFRGDKLRRLHQRKLELAKARNELESFIYNSKDKLSYEEEASNTTLWGYFTKEEREQFKEALNAAEEWLSEVDERTLSVYDVRKTSRSLHAFTDKALERLRKELERLAQERLEQEKAQNTQQEGQAQQQEQPAQQPPPQDTPQADQPQEQTKQEQPSQKPEGPVHDEF